MVVFNISRLNRNFYIYVIHISLASERKGTKTNVEPVRRAFFFLLLLLLLLKYVFLIGATINIELEARNTMKKHTT